jgi:thiosulfate dehydrogenase (quinone) large subunit
MADIREHSWQVLENPRWVTGLFSSTEFAWFWLIARVYIGWDWLHAGLEKVGDPEWMSGGAAISGYWQRAVAIPETGRPRISYDWYRDFLQFLIDADAQTWFGPLVAVGEVVVGIALLLGMFTGIAAFFGAFMNWNFMFAGSASTNPVMGIIAIGLMVAWKIAGWWGLDRFILPYLGAPWQPGPLLGGHSLGLTGRQPNTMGQHIEQWLGILIRVGLALFALSSLIGFLHVFILIIAGVIVAIAGLGILPSTFAGERRGTAG